MVWPLWFRGGRDSREQRTGGLVAYCTPTEASASVVELETPAWDDDHSSVLGRTTRSLSPWRRRRLVNGGRDRCWSSDPGVWSEAQPTPANRAEQQRDTGQRSVLLVLSSGSGFDYAALSARHVRHRGERRGNFVGAPGRRWCAGGARSPPRPDWGSVVRSASPPHRAGRGPPVGVSVRAGPPRRLTGRPRCRPGARGAAQGRGRPMPALSSPRPPAPWRPRCTPGAPARARSRTRRRPRGRPRGRRRGCGPGAWRPGPGCRAGWR